MKNIFVLIGIFALAGCFSDVVTSNYATYEEAVTDNLFDRGWLPSNIPKSSKNIETKNNLDLNTSTGEFTINMEESNNFFAQLKSTDKINNGYTTYKYTKGYRTWVFRINQNNGHVKYELI